MLARANEYSYSKLLKDVSKKTGASYHWVRGDSFLRVLDVHVHREQLLLADYLDPSRGGNLSFLASLPELWRSDLQEESEASGRGLDVLGRPFPSDEVLSMR